MVTLAEIDWQPILGNLWESVFQMPQIAIVMGCLIPIVGIITSYWYKAQKMRAEQHLKRTLAERGMSVDEIERIVAASSRPDHE